METVVYEVQEEARPGEWAAVYLGVAVAFLPAVLPVMVGVLADALGFGVVRAGYVASANLGGVALGSLLCALMARRWSWQRLIRGAAVALIGANLLSMAAAYFPLMASLRLAAGLGEGVIAAICYGAMSHGIRPARALGFYIAGQGLAGAVGMGMIPCIVAEAGWPWLFVLVSLVALPAFWLAQPIDGLRAAPLAQDRRPPLGLSARSMAALLCMLVYFVGMSAVWALTERIGHDAQIEPERLSLALSASAVASMAGSLLVGMLAHRLGTVAGLILGFLAAGLGLLMLAMGHEWRVFSAGVCLFFFAWGFHFPFLFRLLSEVDKKSAVAVLIPLMTGGGFTVGPAIGGLLLAAGGPRAVCGVGAICVTASTLSAVLLYLHAIKKETLP